MNRTRIFFAVLAVWAIFLLGFIAFKQISISTGIDVLLRTEPIDPWDIFRGEYVTLRYDITSIEQLPVSVVPGDRVFVPLEVVDGRAVARGILASPPASGMFIKGTVRYVRGNVAEIEYGIESFFVPQGEAMDIQRERRPVEVRVTIDRNGNAIPRAIIVDGKEVEFPS